MMYTIKIIKLAIMVGITALLLSACSAKNESEESLKQELESAQAEIAEREMKESIEESLRAGLYETTQQVVEQEETSLSLEQEEATETSSRTVEYKTLFVVNCDESVTLRTSPNTSAKEICQIRHGEPVSYIEPAANGFYRVTYLGNEGFVLASYLAEQSEEKETYGVKADSYYVFDKYGTDTMWVVNCNVSISLRTQPDTKASAICQIPLGSQVEVVSLADNGFLRIQYQGKEGYALENYLDVMEPQTAIGMNAKVVNCSESITLRSQPSTTSSEICQIPLGSTVYCVAWSNDDFYKVIYNGQEGYALSKYLKIQ